MNNFSLTIAGVLVAVGGSILLKLGFSETCSNEIVQLTPVIVGGIMSWIGRVKAGGVSLSGFKK